MGHVWETVAVDLELMDFEDDELERLGLLNLGADDLEGLDDPRMDGVIELFCHAFITKPRDATWDEPEEFGGAELHDTEINVNGRLTQVDIAFDFDQIEAIQERVFEAWRHMERL